MQQQLSVYLAGRILTETKKIERLESPLMKEALMRSETLQQEYHRSILKLETYQDLLTVIQTIMAAPSAGIPIIQKEIKSSDEHEG
jgi:hypothetical protein